MKWTITQPQSSSASPRKPTTPLWQQCLLTLLLMSGAVYVLNMAGPSPPSRHQEQLHQQVQYTESPMDGIMNQTPCITYWTMSCPLLKGPYLPTKVVTEASQDDGEQGSLSAVRKGFLRYLTNPLPGYHEASDTLHNLQIILQHSTLGENDKQHWFLYRIANSTYQDQLVTLLEQHEQTYTIVEWDWKVYNKIPYTFHYFDHYKGMRDAIHNKWYRTTFIPPKRAAVLGSAIHDKAMYLYGGNNVRNSMLEWATLEWDGVVDWFVICEPDTLWTLSMQTAVSRALSTPAARNWKYVVVPRVQLTDDDTAAVDDLLQGRHPPPSPWQQTMQPIPEDTYDQTAKLIRQSPSDGYQILLHATAVGRFHAHLRPGRYDVNEFLSRLRIDVYGGWNVTMYGQWLPWEVKLLRAVPSPDEGTDGAAAPVSDSTSSGSSKTDPWRLSFQAPPADYRAGAAVAMINTTTVVRLFTPQAVLSRGEDPINATLLHQQYVTEAMAASLPELDYQAHLNASNTTGPFRDVFANRLLFYDRAILQYEQKLYKQAQWESIDKMEKRVQSLVWMIYKLVEQARMAHRRGPWTVTAKPVNHRAPSNNSHDFYNVAPHYVPPILDDGTLGLTLPYVKKGHGPVSEQHALFGARASRYDETRFASMSYNVTVLSLASFYTGQDLFAQYAVKVLKHWFWDEETAMTPHLRFASVRWNHNESEWQGEHVTDLRSIYLLLDAVQLLDEGGHLKKRQNNLFRQWMADFLEWLETDPQAVGYAASVEDYEGLYYDIMCMSIAYFLGDEVRALHHVHMASSRLRAHFDNRYELAIELKKSSCEDGQMQALYAWHTLARMADHLGVDLWRTKVSDLNLDDDTIDIQDQVRLPDDPLYNPSSLESLPILCAGSARAIPFVLNRPPCQGSSGADRRQSHIRWWPLLDGYLRQCPTWPLENINGTSWMTPKWARRPPKGRYHMPFLFPHEHNIAPFWNLGYRIKPRKVGS